MSVLLQEISALPDVKLLTPHRFGDVRGFFCETWNRQTMRSLGIYNDFVQDNESLSRDAGTLRGLHYQAPPFAQSKLVRVVTGAILDVAVDVRVGSPHFGKSVSVELSADNGLQLLVPRGFLHGFITLHPNTHVIYKVDNPYNAHADGSVRWDDTVLGVDWGGGRKDVILSDKDSKAPKFEDWKSPFTYGENL